MRSQFSDRKENGTDGESKGTHEKSSEEDDDSEEQENEESDSEDDDSEGVDSEEDEIEQKASMETRSKSVTRVRLVSILLELGTNQAPLEIYGRNGRRG